MNTSGLPLYVSTQRMQSLVTQTREQLDVARIEAVTSRAAVTADAVEGDIGKVQMLEKQIDDIDRRVTNLNLLESDFSVVDNTLSTARDRAVQIATQLDAAIGQNNTTAIEALQSQAEADLRMIVGALNSDYGGRQLFSGAATDTPPISDVETLLSDVNAIVDGASGSLSAFAQLNTYFDDVAGGFATTIYQGSAIAGPDREVSSTRRIGVDVKANDQEIKDILRGLAVIATADMGDTSKLDEIRRDAATNLRNGADAIIGKQSELGSLQSEANILLTRSNAERVTYTTALNDLVGVDQFEAASDMTALETQLQAIYATTARIASLSFVNFLR